MSPRAGGWWVLVWVTLGGCLGALATVLVVAEDRRTPKEGIASHVEHEPVPVTLLGSGGDPTDPGTAAGSDATEPQQPVPSTASGGQVEPPPTIVAMAADDVPPELEPHTDERVPGPDELRRARQLTRQYGLWGDRSKYVVRVEMGGDGQVRAAAGLQRAATRMAPDSWTEWLLTQSRTLQRSR